MKIIVITGPTGVGKTKLSIEIAKKLNGEIINADSTQVYKNLDIATAKIKEEEKEGISHHLFDIKTIYEDYSVYDYQKDVRKKIAEILKRNKTPILVGGTGLYIKAGLYDYDFTYNNIHSNYDSYSTSELYDLLIKVDPNTKIDKNNRIRIIRSLDYFQNTKKPMSRKPKNNKLLYDTIFIGLTTDRNTLYDIINKRVDKMLENGLLKEAYDLYKDNIKTKAVMTPIGYKELFLFFNNTKSLDECISDIKTKSRRYAKKQYTWFNNQMDIKWFKTDYDCFNNTIKDVLNYIESCD